MTLVKVNLLCFLVFLHNKNDPLPPFEMEPHASITHLFFALRRILSYTQLCVFFSAMVWQRFHTSWRKKTCRSSLKRKTLNNNDQKQVADQQFPLEWFCADALSCSLAGSAHCYLRIPIGKRLKSSFITLRSSPCSTGEHLLLNFCSCLQEYSTKQLTSLVTCGVGSHVTKKGKQKLLSIIEDMERSKPR